MKRRSLALRLLLANLIVVVAGAAAVAPGEQGEERGDEERYAHGQRQLVHPPDEPAGA